VCWQKAVCQRLPITELPSIGYVALRGRCPRCGRGALYKGLLDITERCSVCALPLTNHEQGDGPGFFAVLLIGMLAGIGAALVEVYYAPPFWLHALLWIPFVIIGTLLALRWIKAAIIAIQYRTRIQDFQE